MLRWPGRHLYMTLSVSVEDLLLKGVEGLVEFQPSMACGESCYEDVGFGPFDRILLDAGVDSLQDVVSTEAESADIESGIGDETEQMGRVLDGDGGGFVDTLAEFAPDPVQHQLGVSLATGIFGNAGNRELKNHDDDRKWVTVYCASATSKFRRRGVVDFKQSRITSSCNPQGSAGINPLF